MCIADTLKYDYNIIYKCVNYTMKYKSLFNILNLQIISIRRTICAHSGTRHQVHGFISITPECSSNCTNCDSVMMCHTKTAIDFLEIKINRHIYEGEKYKISHLWKYILYNYKHASACRRLLGFNSLPAYEPICS